MSLTRLILAAFVIFSLGLLAGGCGQGEKTDQAAQSEQKPSVDRASQVILKATVEAVDYEARTFTLKDEHGNTQTLQVKNPLVPLENLKAGDNVIMTIYQREVAYVAAPGGELPPDEGLRAVGSPQGQEDQNITVVNAQQITSTVETVDVENRMVTLVGSDGMPVAMPVRDDVQNLDKLKAGDQVVMQITQVISVSKVQ